MFLFVSLSKLEFFTLVALVLLVYHSCRTLALPVALVLLLCFTLVTFVSIVSHSCCIHVAYVALVSLVSDAVVVS